MQLLPYTNHLFNQGLRPNTVSTHLAALRHMSIINGYGDPMINTPMLTLARRGATAAAPPRPLREPITLPTLVSFLSSLNLSQFDDSVFFAMCCLAFFGFMRISEYTVSGTFDPIWHLTWRRATFCPRGLTLHLKHSKGDRLRDGVNLFLAKNHSPICPVAALAHYRHIGQQSGLAFHPDAPLFMDSNSQPVNTVTFTDKLRHHSAICGIRANIAPHSLRIGAATTAWRAGFTDSQIQFMGRWKSLSFKKYLRPCSNDYFNLSNLLANSGLNIHLGGPHIF